MAPRHIGTNRDRPDGQLIPRQQVPGKGEQERQEQQNDTDNPIEFSWRFVTARQEHSIHVQPDGNHHGVCPPAMQFPQHAQRRDIAQCQHVGIGPFGGGAIVEHQQHARDDLDQKQEEGDPAHAPGVAERNSLFIDGDGMQVQEEIGQDNRRTIAAVDRCGVSENTLPNLRVANNFPKRSHIDRSYLSVSEGAQSMFRSPENMFHRQQGDRCDVDAPAGVGNSVPTGIHRRVYRFTYVADTGSC